MPRYVALLRGVSPMNLKMPALKHCLADIGFDNVCTVLSSGNAAFDAPVQAGHILAHRIEAATATSLGRSFPTLVRRSDHLRALQEDDPFAAFDLPPGMKKVVTFLREPPATPPPLPLESDDIRILAIRGPEVFTAYVPMPGNPAFMRLLQKTFGDSITTRTWETVAKCASA